MKKLLLFTILLSFSAAFNAQNGFVKGVITDDIGDEILGADILLDGKNVTVTNMFGAYLAETEAGKRTITFKAIGFDDIVKEIIIAANDTITLDIAFEDEQGIMDEVVVSAGKYEQKLSDITVSMAVLKPSLIEAKNTVTCEEIIEQVPGVNMQENQVSIRGGSGFSYGAGSRVLVMVDDMPMLSGDANDVKWSSLPIENVEQIEVIKGASSVLFGSSALNGVIHIRTGFPRNKPKTNVRMFSGFYDKPFADYKGNTINGKTDSTIDRSSQSWSKGPLFYSGFNFFHSRKIKSNFDLTVGGAAFSDAGYRLGEFENRGRFNMNTRYRSKKIEGLSIGVNMNTQAANGSLFFLWQNADSVLIPRGGIDTATTTLSEYKTYRTNVDPYITYYSKKGHRHTLRTRWYNTTNVNNTQQGSRANTYYSEYQFQKRNAEKAFAFTTGLVAMKTNVNSDLYGDHFSNNLATYVQFDKKFFGKLNVSGGLRAEYYKIDTSATKSSVTFNGKNLPFQPVARIGATYELAQFTFLRASYGQGYRFPTIAEKYVSTSVDILRIYPNPRVEAETGWSAEIGIKQGFKIRNFKGYLDVAGFLNQYDNMMEFMFGLYRDNGDAWDIEQHGFPTLDNLGAQSQNVQSARISGIDFQIMGEGKFTENLGFTIFAGYTYMNPISLNSDSAYLATFSDTSSVNPDRTLKYRFKHLVKFDGQITYKKIALGFSARFNSYTPNIDGIFQYPIAGTIAILPGMDEYRKSHTKGDWVFDTRFAVEMTEHLKTSIVVKNLFNREYMSRPGDVMPPRVFALQLSVTI